MTGSARPINIPGIPNRPRKSRTYSNKVEIDIDGNFSLIEPTAVLRSIVNLKTIPELSGFFLAEGEELPGVARVEFK
jgi:hypothetical protein